MRANADGSLVPGKCPELQLHDGLVACHRNKSRPGLGRTRGTPMAGVSQD